MIAIKSRDLNHLFDRWKMNHQPSFSPKKRQTWKKIWKDGKTTGKMLETKDLERKKLLGF